MQRATFLRIAEYALLIFFVAIVGLDLLTAFARPSFFLTHDEAEHLHVVFALHRGERPYLDFIENHPVFLHALLSLFADQLPSRTIDLAILLKFIIALHCIGAITLTCDAARPLLNIQSRLRHILVSLVGLSLFGVWSAPIQTYPLWTLRPDWVCYFYAVLCIWLYQEALKRRLLDNLSEKHFVLLMALSGLSGGLATAILAKSAYILIPCVVAVTGLLLSTPWAKLRALGIQHWRALLGGHSSLLLVFVLATFACIWLELTISGTSFDAYYRANFAFNASKHIPYSSAESNPATMLVNISGLSFTGVVVLGLLVYLSLRRWQLHPDVRAEGIMLFCLATIILNAVLPSFSNGLTWAHYFIPSFLVLTILFAWALTQMARFMVQVGTSDVIRRLPKRLHELMLVLLVMQALFVAGNLAVESLARFRALENVRDLYQIGNGDRSMEYLPDRYLPQDLVYLTILPQSKPVRARAWSYYFMLFPDNSAFTSMQDLGLAPPLVPYWKKLFRETPPDAILMQSEDEVRTRTLITQIAGNGDLSWLWRTIEPAYSCRSRQSIALFVRNDLLHRFAEPEWHSCPKTRNNNAS